MDVFTAIKKRRNIRAYSKEKITKEELEMLIDAMRWAPSAGNIQPWEFIIVSNTEIKHKLSIAALDQTFIEETPIIVVVCANEKYSERGYGNRGKTLYCLQDTAAAIQNLLLAAHALGLGTCWIGAFNEEEVRRILNVPIGVRPVAIVPVGHPSEKPRTRQRRLMKDIIHYETF